MTMFECPKDRAVQDPAVLPVDRLNVLMSARALEGKMIANTKGNLPDVQLVEAMDRLATDPSSLVKVFDQIYDDVKVNTFGPMVCGIKAQYPRVSKFKFENDRAGKLRSFEFSVQREPHGHSEHKHFDVLGKQYQVKSWTR
ncbi:MAG: hypothetical protein KC777_20915 [Cyanobacteria bacterium HKST-UBA02]|nr:hypothetical protein [Cyanobacteria bacterium HKST-UBA02]